MQWEFKCLVNSPELTVSIFTTSVQYPAIDVEFSVINYFGPTMYKSLGFSASQSLLVQGIYGAVGPITNFLYVLCFICVRFHIHDSFSQASLPSSLTLWDERSLSCSAQAASWSPIPFSQPSWPPSRLAFLQITQHNVRVLL